MSDKRYDLGWGNVTADQKTFPLWHYGVVVQNDDPSIAGRIRVRIEGIDNDVSLKDQLNEPKKGGLPWCQPLMPKFFNVIPKVGEVVKIAMFDYRNKKIRREYVGPVIAQQRPPDFIDSQYFPTKWAVELDSYKGTWSQDSQSFDGDWKIYPNIDDIAISGRKNTDFILRDKKNYDEIILRAGKIDYQSIINNEASQTKSNIVGGTFKLNRKNPAYITINHTLPQTYASTASARETSKKLNLDKDRTHVNVVADKINLISHAGSQKKGFVRSILKGEDVLTQIKVENEKLHPLIYGDVFYEFMEKLKKYVEGHIHPYSNVPPDPSLATADLLKWFNSNMGKKVDKKSPDGTKYKDIENCGFLSKGVKTN